MTTKKQWLIDLLIVSRSMKDHLQNKPGPDVPFHERRIWAEQLMAISDRLRELLHCHPNEQTPEMVLDIIEALEREV